MKNKAKFLKYSGYLNCSVEWGHKDYVSLGDSIPYVQRFRTYARFMHNS